MDGEKTKLTKAHNKSKSLRTTVPMSIVSQFGLKEGSMLVWKFESIKKRVLIVQAKK